MCLRSVNNHCRFKKFCRSFFCDMEDEPGSWLEISSSMRLIFLVRGYSVLARAFSPPSAAERVRSFGTIEWGEQGREGKGREGDGMGLCQVLNQPVKLKRSEWLGSTSCSTSPLRKQARVPPVGSTSTSPWFVKRRSFPPSVSDQSVFR